MMSVFLSGKYLKLNSAIKVTVCKKTWYQHPLFVIPKKKNNYHVYGHKENKSLKLVFVVSAVFGSFWYLLSSTTKCEEDAINHSVVSEQKMDTDLKRSGFKNWLHKFIILMAYLPVLLWHKFGVLWYGIWLNMKLRNTGLHVSLSRLIFHDWSKFSFAELMPYAERFEDNCLDVTIIGRLLKPFAKWTKSGEFSNVRWEEAWKHHYQNNDHHPEFWKNGNQLTKMPDEAVVEMVADWHAAQWGYDGQWPQPGNWKWLENCKFSKLDMHPVSRALFFSILGALGYEKDIKDYSWSNAEHVFEHHGTIMEQLYLILLKRSCDAGKL